MPNKWPRRCYKKLAESDAMAKCEELCTQFDWCAGYTYRIDHRNCDLFTVTESGPCPHGCPAYTLYGGDGPTLMSKDQFVAYPYAVNNGCYAKFTGENKVLLNISSL